MNRTGKQINFFDGRNKHEREGLRYSTKSYGTITFIRVREVSELVELENIVNVAVLLFLLLSAAKDIKTYDLILLVRIICH